MKDAIKNKICFVLSPIGDKGTDIRNKADQVLNYIITPIAKEFDYEILRADKISEPGIITSQIIEHIIQEDLVIADLTDHNPNMFYELAIRHTTKKPYIQLIEKGQSIPFDTAANRTILIDIHDLSTSEDSKKELREQIKCIEKNPDKIDSPVSTTIDLFNLRQGGDVNKRIVADIFNHLTEIKHKVNYIIDSNLGHFTNYVRNYHAHEKLLPRETSPKKLIKISTPEDIFFINSDDITSGKSINVRLFTEDLKEEKIINPSSGNYRKRKYDKIISKPNIETKKKK